MHDMMYNDKKTVVILLKIYKRRFKMKFLVFTQGCKVNQYDSDIISREMLSAGFSMAEDEESPDIVIVNSCTVTENGDKKALRLTAKLKRDYPNAVTVLTGCYPQAFPEEAGQKGIADIVVGNSGKRDIPRLVSDYLDGNVKCCGIKENETVFSEPAEFFHSDRTRAFIKIEDGCNRFCSYCIIPVARGRVRSRSLENIARETSFHAADGHKEIVLTGINLSCYGSDIGLSLFDAVKTVSEEPFIERVRLSSLEPELLTEDIIEKMAGIQKLCPHFHLSLQSGCNATLKRMNRHYTAEEYEVIVKNLRSAFPSCSVTTDIMVGFAGETEEEFEESLRFAEKIGFAKIHVFTYSLRPGTAAAKMGGHIPDSTKEERYKRMLQVAEKSQKKNFESNLNTVHKMLIERQTNPDYINGYTENYIPLHVLGGKAKRHDIVSVKITKVQNGFCEGVLV